MKWQVEISFLDNTDFREALQLTIDTDSNKIQIWGGAGSVQIQPEIDLDLDLAVPRKSE
jgi:hypothetical protein